MSKTKGREGSPVSLLSKPFLESPLLVAPGSSDATCRPRKAIQAERVGGEIELAIDPDALCAVFGVDNAYGYSLLSQLLNVIQPDPRKPVDVASVDQALALIEGINPGDTIEAMTATMLIGAQPCRTRIVAPSVAPRSGRHGRRARRRERTLGHRPELNALINPASPRLKIEMMHADRNDAR